MQVLLTLNELSENYPSSSIGSHAFHTMARPPSRETTGSSFTLRGDTQDEHDKSPTSSPVIQTDEIGHLFATGTCQPNPNALPDTAELNMLFLGGIPPKPTPLSAAPPIHCAPLQLPCLITLLTLLLQQAIPTLIWLMWVRSQMVRIQHDRLHSE